MAPSTEDNLSAHMKGVNTALLNERRVFLCLTDDEHLESVFINEDERELF